MKKVKKYILLIVILLIAILSIFINSYQKKESQKPIPFSSYEWINGEWKERYRMLEDLENNYDLVGMSRDEIEELLGEYSVRSEDVGSDYNVVEYYLGFSIREDYWEGIEVLLIGFRDDIVVKYEYEYLSWL